MLLQMKSRLLYRRPTNRTMNIDRDSNVGRKSEFNASRASIISRILIDASAELPNFYHCIMRLTENFG